jgi:hypothetical protein
MAPGCGNSVQSKIIGTWVLDLEATRALPHFQAMSDEQKKQLDGMTLEVTFTQTTMTKSTSVLMLDGLDKMKDSVSGTYRINRSKGNTLVLAVQTSEGMKRVGIEVKGDNQLVLDMDESKTVVKRK